MKYDYLIIGAGLFGSIFAYEANKVGKTVLVIDQRNHIGGNCYSEKFEDYDIHKYGPHIFHTSQKYIWDYINKFTAFNNFTLRNKAYYKNKIYSFSQFLGILRAFKLSFGKREYFVSNRFSKYSSIRIFKIILLHILYKLVS